MTTKLSHLSGLGRSPQRVPSALPPRGAEVSLSGVGRAFDSKLQTSQPPDILAAELAAAMRLHSRFLTTTALFPLISCSRPCAGLPFIPRTPPPGLPSPSLTTATGMSPTKSIQENVLSPWAAGGPGARAARHAAPRAFALSSSLRCRPPRSIPSVGGRSTLAPEPAERGRRAAVQQLRGRDHRRGAGPAAGAGPGRGGGPGARRGCRGASKPEEESAASERARRAPAWRGSGGRSPAPTAARQLRRTFCWASSRSCCPAAVREGLRDKVSPPSGLAVLAAPPPLSFKGTVEICEGSRRKGTPGGSARGKTGCCSPATASSPRRP